MKNTKIFAVVGMAGSGKSEVVNYLTTEFGWPKLYLGKYTFERIKSEGLENNYQNEKIIREKIRQELGMGAYAKLAIDELKGLLAKNETVVIESLYSWSEYKILKENFGDRFKVIAVHASPQTRLSRLLDRKKERPMSSEKEFTERDYSEIENIEKGGPIARADFHLVNEGKDIESLHNKINKLDLKTN